ncbi:hypothetical protein Tco_0268929 [Tanacetum coccineum]
MLDLLAIQALEFEHCLPRFGHFNERQEGTDVISCMVQENGSLCRFLIQSEDVGPLLLLVPPGHLCQTPGCRFFKDICRVHSISYWSGLASRFRVSLDSPLELVVFPAVLVVVSLGALVEAGSFPDLLLLDPRSVPAEGS